MTPLFELPGMLWWSAAAAVPILIHLFSRRRFQRVNWAAMEFLNRAFKKTRRRVRFENLLLLIVRVAVLLLLAFALAAPKIGSSALIGSGADAQKSVFLLVDDSFSMDLRDATGEQSPFLRAKRRAAAIVADLDGERDSASLITLGTPAHLVLAPTHDITRVGGELEKLTCSSSSGDVLSALRLVDARIQDPSFARDFPGRRIAYLFTDLQRSPFFPKTDAGAGGDAEKSLAEGPSAAIENVLRSLKESGVETIVIDTGGDKEMRPQNAAVTMLTATDRSLVRGQKTTFECRLQNFGNQTISGDLKFYVDQESAFERTERVQTLKGLSTGTREETEMSFTFDHVFAEPGWHHVMVKFEDDGLKVDNVRRYAFFVRDNIKVLVINGYPGREPEDAASFYLARAFDPELGRARVGNTTFVVQETSVQDVMRETLLSADIVCLADVVNLPAPKLKDLEAFVERGGALVFIPGRNVEADLADPSGGAIASTLWKSGQGLLPLKYARALGSEDPAAEPYFLQFPETLHPSLAYFRDPRVQTIVSQTAVLKFLETEPVPNDGSVATLLNLRLGKGDTVGRLYPLLAVRQKGKGVVAQMTTSADRRWNYIGPSGVIVPLMRELGQWMTRPQDSANLLVGRAHVERFDPSTAKVTVTEGQDPPEERTTSPMADKSATELQFNRLTQAELITLQFQETVVARDGQTPAGQRSALRKLVVNVDASESDLERVDAAALVSAFGSDLLRVLGDDETLEAANDPDAAVGWWRPLLYVLLAFLVLETVLARRFTPRAETAAVA